MNQMNENDSKQYYQSYAENYIATYFAGWQRKEAINFVEAILERLKQQASETKEKRIRDILGRKCTL